MNNETHTTEQEQDAIFDLSKLTRSENNDERGTNAAVATYNSILGFMQAYKLLEAAESDDITASKRAELIKRAGELCDYVEQAVEQAGENHSELTTHLRDLEREGSALDIGYRVSGFSFSMDENGRIEPDEARILLGYGGPAVQLLGDWEHEDCGLGTFSECKLQAQDWGTKWEDLDEADSSVITDWANLCYGY